MYLHSVAARQQPPRDQTAVSQAMQTGSAQVCPRLPLASRSVRLHSAGVTHAPTGDWRPRPNQCQSDIGGVLRPLSPPSGGEARPRRCGLYSTVVMYLLL